MENSVQLVQKSKSSGNVGPLLSRRIWRGRSKSQTRPCAEVQPTKAQWTPQVTNFKSSSKNGLKSFVAILFFVFLSFRRGKVSGHRMKVE